MLAGFSFVPLRSWEEMITTQWIKSNSQTEEKKRGRERCAMQSKLHSVSLSLLRCHDQRVSTDPSPKERTRERPNTCLCYDELLCQTTSLWDERDGIQIHQTLSSYEESFNFFSPIAFGSSRQADAACGRHRCLGVRRLSPKPFGYFKYTRGRWVYTHRLLRPWLWWYFLIAHKRKRKQGEKKKVKGKAKRGGWYFFTGILVSDN